MENCKNCIFYDVEYDNLIQSGNDKTNKEKYYCRMWKDGIPTDISNDKIKCKYKN